jgi:NTE family protein
MSPPGNPDTGGTPQAAQPDDQPALPSLRRLLPREATQALLAASTGSLPEAAVAVVAGNGRVVACHGQWPDGPPEYFALSGAAQSSPLNHHRVYPLMVGSQSVGAVVGCGPVSAALRAAEQGLQQSLSLLLAQAMEKRAIAYETLNRYREVRLLYRVGETIGGSLDPAAIPQLLLDHSRFIPADVGLVVLFGDGTTDIKATFGEPQGVTWLSEIAVEDIGQAWPVDHPAIVTELAGQAPAYAAIVWVPLRTTQRTLGGIVLARAAGRPVFTASDQDLLMALATPSALALENARLFEDLQQTLQQTLEMKQLVERVCAFMASGSPADAPRPDFVAAIRGPGDDAGDSLGAAVLSAQVPLLAALPAEARAAVTSELEWFSLPGGWTLFRQGEIADGLYIVLSGRLGVMVTGAGGRETLIAEVSGGEVVGEMAVIAGGVRSATVVGLRNSTLVRLSKAAFETLVREYPDAMLRLAQLLVKRLERVVRGDAPPPSTKTFAILPLGADVPVSEFARRLTAALARVGVHAHLVRTDDAHRSMEWFHNVEAAHDVVVYEADASNSAWTQLCIRQADCVVLTASAGSAPVQRSEAEDRLDATVERRWRRRRELVLLQPSGVELPSGTRHWLAGREVAMHHHVRLDRAADLERLARLLIGRAVGLVLSGGATRGAAHLGIIRALRAAGVPIDLVGGVSIGSVVASGVAHEWDDAHMLRMYSETLTDSNPLGDYTLPLVSLAAGRRVSRLLRKSFRDVNIQDLWLNFFCVSSNLTSGRLEVHRSGPLWRAVRASVSLPGILPPVVEGGQVLVDGGVMNNLPVDVMQQMGRGPTIASDISAADSLIAPDIDPEALSIWQLAARVWRKHGDDAVPNIVRILLRSGTVSTTTSAGAAGAQADLLLRPPATLVDLASVDWTAGKRLADIGYDYAAAELARLDAIGALARFSPRRSSVSGDAVVSPA